VLKKLTQIYRTNVLTPVLYPYHRGDLADLQGVTGYSRRNRANP